MTRRKVGLMRDSGIKEEVKLRNDIVSVVSEYVTLRRTGKNYAGICPFHVEKTPSFTVAPDKQMFYCFGCHQSGDVVTFIMKKENKSFTEALKMLADRAGIDMPQADLPPAEAALFARRRAILDALAKAAGLYSKWLNEERGEAARRYLEDRGLSSETLSRFGIGFAPDSWDEVSRILKQDGHPEERMIATGLCLARQKGGGVYDRFRNRVMFPIKDLQGRTVGFGGRSIDGSNPKYINSPQTEVFNKGKGLFALNIAREPAREEGALVVVEGYMDAITAHQAGFRNVVASLGTALTSDQAKQLVMLSQHIIIAYDADAAGQAATLRGLDVLRQAGGSVRICEVPEGKDPDDFIRSKGADAFRKILQDASTVVEYYYRLYRRKFGDSRAGRLRTVESMVPIIASVENSVEFASYISMVANSSGVPEPALRAEVQKARKRLVTGVQGHKTEQSRNTKTDTQNMEEPASRATPAQSQAEQSILSLMISDPGCRKKGLGDLHKGMFTGRNVQVYEALCMCPGDVSISASEVALGLGPELGAYFAGLAVREVPGELPERLRIMKDCILVLKKRRFAELHTLIQSKLTGEEGFSHLFGEYQVLLREIKGNDPSKSPS